MEDSTKQKIKQLLREIKENNHKKVIVYSLDGCPACEDYKLKIDKLGLVYENVEMTDNDKMWDKLKTLGGSEYVPQVQVDGYLIKEDEYDDVNELISKTLSNLLQRKIVIK
jgi:glutaredoxin